MDTGVTAVSVGFTVKPLVLCGHNHGNGEIQVLEKLRMLTGLTE
jgi:hypothetical protein